MAKSLSDAFDEYIAINGADAVLSAIRKTRLSSVKEKFSKSIPDAVDLKVLNWDALEVLSLKPTGQDGPANVFEEILTSIEIAISAKNSAMLIESLLLLWKAVKRG